MHSDPTSGSTALPLTPLNEVIDIVMSRVPGPQTEDVPLAESLGRILAEDVVSQRSLPPFRSSAMDGYALCCGGHGALSGSTFEVLGTVAAGATFGDALGLGQAVRIMTGAPVPPKADVVVMVEQTTSHPHPVSDRPDTVEINADVAHGSNIRRAGEDIKPGELVLHAGAVIDPTGIAAAVNAGPTSVPVGKRPRVAVCTTGDELAGDGEKLSGAKIPDSNRPMLLAAVDAAGCIPIDAGRLGDERATTERGIARAVAMADFVITTGGVSAGDFDYVQYVLGDLGWSQRFRIAMKPGKPFSFAVIEDTPVFALPGNPVSAYVAFELLVRPALRAALGSSAPFRPWAQARFADDRPAHHDGKTHFLRIASLWDDHGLLVKPVTGQGSHQMAALSLSNGIAALESGRDVHAGDLVPTLLWR